MHYGTKPYNAEKDFFVLVTDCLHCSGNFVRANSKGEAVKKGLALHEAAEKDAGMGCDVHEEAIAFGWDELLDVLWRDLKMAKGGAVSVKWDARTEAAAFWRKARQNGTSGN